MPWLAWNWKRQTYANRELIVVSSGKTAGNSLCAFRLARSTLSIGEVCWSFSEHRGVAEKFNKALELAGGEYVMLWGDDDWQHPQRIEHAVQMAQEYPGTRVVSWSHGWFVGLQQRKAITYQCDAIPVASLALVQSEAANAVRFDMQRPVASDTRWMETISAGKKCVLCNRDFTPSLWLCHGTNMNNRDYPFETNGIALEEVCRQGNIDVQAWGDTETQMDNLQQRLSL